MTVEQIELRKILTQMLADNGINRETILQFAKDIIDEKVEKAIKQVMNETNIDGLISISVRKIIAATVKEEVSNKVRRALGNTTITMECREIKED